MAQTVRATTDRWCDHLHLLHGGPTILMVHYEEKKIFALTFEALVEVDFLVLNFKHADRNNNQVAQSLRFANNVPPNPMHSLYIRSKERGDYQSQR
jgi:hypothetical protein